MNRIINSTEFRELKILNHQEENFEKTTNEIATAIIRVNLEPNLPHLRNSIFSKTKFELALLQITENKKKEKRQTTFNH